MLEHLLLELSKRYHFSLKEESLPKKWFYLSIDATTSLKFNELESGFTIESLICQTPKELKEDLLILLMKANFLGQGTQGAMLALSETGSSLIFKKDIEQNLSYIEFKEKIEEFVNYLNYWKKRINEEIQKKRL